MYGRGGLMKKRIGLILTISIFFLSSCGYRLVKVDEIEPTSTIRNTKIAPTVTTQSCNIQSKYHSDWNEILCEEFNGGYSQIWQGTDANLEAYISGGKYIIDNKTQVTSGYQTGYLFGVLFQRGIDYLISFEGKMDSLYNDCTWGIFLGADPDDYGYHFMINNQGEWFLTYDTDNDALRYLGNLAAGTTNSINWNGINRITAVIENGIIKFHVNDELITTYDTEDFKTNEGGLIIWGAEGVEATYMFDNLVVKSKLE